MSVISRIFSCTITAMLTAGDAIFGAFERHKEQLAPRLPKDLLAAVRNQIDLVRNMEVAQKSARSTVGKLTQEQNDKLEVLVELLRQVRSSAKQAFRGEQVKLREQFRIGGEKRFDLGFVIEEARLVHAACAQADNATALSAKGWIQSDTERLASAIQELDATDDVQETAKGSKVDTTGELINNANELYRVLLAIQNAANIQWPASESTNAGIRAEFRLGIFPGKAASAAKEKVNTSKTKTPSATPLPSAAQTTTPPAASA
jgi:HAMP domain-containing protein